MKTLIAIALMALAAPASVAGGLIWDDATGSGKYMVAIPSGDVIIVRRDGKKETAHMNGTTDRNGDSVAVTHDGVAHIIRGDSVTDKNRAGDGGDWLISDKLRDRLPR